MKSGWMGRQAMRRAAFSLALAASASLSACESGARQDAAMQPTGTCSFMLPSMTGTLNYKPHGEAPDSRVAYPDTKTPIYCDRPLSESISSAIELADYKRALEQAGLEKLLMRDGPYTVFAIPNGPLEAYAGTGGGTLMQPANRAALRSLMAYTIVPGKWPVDRLKKRIAQSKTRAFGLRTLDGVMLTVSLDPATNQVVLHNGAGMLSRLWVMGVPQSNGMLYLTQSLLTPVAPPLPAKG